MAQQVISRLLSLFLILGTISACTSKDIPIADFESGTFDGWIVEGNAFGTTPATGTLNSQMEVSGFEGTYLANSYHSGDNTVGTITSREFTIQRNYINFLIGG